LTVLITGFEVFNQMEYNPSQVIVENIQQLECDGVKTLILPVCFEHSFELLKNSLPNMKPSFILQLGVNAKISEVQIENLAINFNDARILDNSGNMPKHQRINPNLELAYAATIDPMWLSQQLNKFEITNSFSYSAGTFVCNYLYFRSLSELTIPCVFIHVPYYEQDDLELKKIANAIILISKEMLNKL
jgi:pyroglutamyl-peptidase